MSRSFTYTPVNLIDPEGNEVAVNSSVKEKLISEGWSLPTAAPAKKKKSDDLKALIHVDKVRAKKLVDLKLDSYHKVAAVSAEDLSKHLDVSEETAEEIILDAQDLE